MGAAELLGPTVTLSSDEFEGRFPGTKGEEKTLKELHAQFQKKGCTTQEQTVPLTEVNNLSESVWNVTTEKGKFNLTSPTEITKSTLSTPKEHIELTNKEFIFVGFGINATDDYNWNDYGKCDVALVSDPGSVMANDSSFDSKFPKGKMTYY